MHVEFKNKQLKHSQLIKEFSYKIIPKSSLTSNLQRFIFNISRSSVLFKLFHSITYIDTELLAFSTLKKNMIENAKKYLEKIKIKLKEMETIKFDINAVRLTTTDIEDIKLKISTLNHKLLECSQKICNYSSRYYELIPKKGFEKTKITPLDKVHEVDKELNFLDQLVYVEKTVKIILGALHRQMEINPLDYCFYSLNCKIDKLQYDNPEYKYLKNYVQMSYQVQNFENNFTIYKVDRREENLDRFNNTPNHLLLFHGTKIFNMLGILAHVNY